MNNKIVTKAIALSVLQVTGFSAVLAATLMPMPPLVTVLTYAAAVACSTLGRVAAEADSN